MYAAEGEFLLVESYAYRNGRTYTGVATKDRYPHCRIFDNPVLALGRCWLPISVEPVLSTELFALRF